MANSLKHDFKLICGSSHPPKTTPVDSESDPCYVKKVLEAYPHLEHFGMTAENLALFTGVEEQFEVGGLSISSYYPIYHEFFDKMRTFGIDTILDGCGGEMTLTSHGQSFWTQTLSSFRWKTFLLEAMRARRTRALSMKTLLRQTFEPLLPQRLASSRVSAPDFFWTNTLNPEFVNRFDAQTLEEQERQEIAPHRSIYEAELNQIQIFQKRLQPHMGKSYGA